MRERITGLKLSEDDRRFIDSILEIISRELPKSQLTIQVKPVIEKFHKSAINGLVRGIVTDLQCHLGLYKSNEIDYKFKDAAFSLGEGIAQLINVLKLVKQNTDFDLPDPIYQLFQRWIIFEEEKIEVEGLHADHWNYHLFKASNKDDYYFSIMLNVSAGYWVKVFKMNEEDKSILKAAIESNRDDVIKSMADKIRDDYYAGHYTR
jgi:hypothetical protein